MKTKKVNLEMWFQVLDKWERVCCGNGENGALDCVFCQEFRHASRSEIKISCNGCPISRHVKQDGCDGTPYVDWAKKLTRISGINYARGQEAFEVAEMELEFLNCLFEKWLEKERGEI